jgi:hypothetical protein
MKPAVERVERGDAIAAAGQASPYKAVGGPVDF